MGATVQLDAQGYRRFGLTTAAVLVSLFGVLIPWLFELGYPLWPWLLGSALAAMAVLAPQSLGPVYRAWMRFGSVMNAVNTRLILGIVFYGLFVPLGLAMRLFGRDALQLRADKTRSSYRVKSHNESRDNVERPF